MSDLKPGEFVGADGKRWRVLGVFYEEIGKLYDNDAIADASHPDFPAAVEALAKLIPEPFEWECEGKEYRFVHTRPEYRSDDGSWHPVSDMKQSFWDAGRDYERERGHADE